MKEQLIHFYNRNAKPFYIIKQVGKTASMLSGGSLNELLEDFENLPNGSYMLVVASNERGFANQPEFPFSIRPDAVSRAGAVTQLPNSESVEELMRKAYERGQSDTLEKQAREKRESLLDWLHENKELLEKAIEYVKEDTAPAPQKSMMDVMGEIPDFIDTISSMKDLGFKNATT